MIESADVSFRPDYAILPGETLRESLEALGMTQVDLSRRTGLSTKHVNQIIQGVAPTDRDPELAGALQDVPGWVPVEHDWSFRADRRERA